MVSSETNTRSTCKTKSPTVRCWIGGGPHPHSSVSKWFADRRPAVRLHGVAAASLPELVRRGDYRRSWLRPDLLAGLTVAAMLVPQAMAYAELGGLPPSAGFRAALVALPIYALIGTSRHLGIGPEPGTAILAAAAAVQLADGDPARYAALMATIAGTGWG